MYEATEVWNGAVPVQPLPSVTAICYLFTGCAGSWLLRCLFSSCGAHASDCSSFPHSRAQALGHRLGRRGPPAQLLHGTWDLLPRLRVEPASPALVADSLPLSLQGSPQPSLSIASYFPMTKELPLKKNHLTQAPNLLALSFLSSSQLTVSTCGFHALTSHSSLSPFQIGFCPTIRQKQLLPRSPWPPPTSLNHTGVFAAIPELSAAAMHFCSRLLPHALPPPYSTTPDASGFSPFLWSLLWTPVQGHCS